MGIRDSLRITVAAGLLVLAVLLGKSCAQAPLKEELPNYNDALRTHTCTPEQMARVQEETTYCINETTFKSSYCYGTAIIRICTPVPKPEPPTTGDTSCH